ncbi:MAG: excinuclease ABC subunit UvrC [Betaproteobacteria bacterium]|nr:excinuclease ABC subunit UvrC [Betaproteobacteria bacterium]MDE2623449.1 excinuclease ABC subunit UvrC [Betaproteobacteria bacterium]
MQEGTPPAGPRSVFVSTFDLAVFLKTLPNQPGVYRMKNAAGEVIYVGKARDLKRRVSSYFQKTHDNPRTRLMVSQIASVEVTLTASEAEALLLEGNLIKSLYPRFNVLFKDDKSYPYIQLSGHEFPQIRLYRGTLDSRHDYFGPYPNAWAAREVIGHLQKLFRLRTCEDAVFRNRSRPCLLHQIHRCSGPCVGAISKAAYRRDIENARSFLGGHESEVLDELRQAMSEASDALDFETAAYYRDRIALMQQVLARQAVSSVQERDVDVVAVVTEQGAVALNLVMIRGGRHLGDKTFFPQNAEDADAETVAEAFLSQHYALQATPAKIITNAPLDAPALSLALGARAGRAVQVVTRPQGEGRSWLQGAEQNARFALEQRRAQQTAQGARVEALQEALGLGQAPQRMECFDISHTQGEATVGSCVVFEGGEPFKADYRRYNISDITPGDDYAALRSLLERRYRKIMAGEGKLPDLILIDGGRGQLNSALAILGDLGVRDIPILGIAKGEGRKPGLEVLIYPEAGKTLKLPPDHPGFHLLQAIRDEAHRFAITGHRNRRARARTRSSLEDVSGIGAKRRQKLLAQFGGLRGVENASVEDIAAVPGIGLTLARKIYQQLH